MIRTAFNGMIAVMLAKFLLNDVPHAVGLLDNPGQEDPTPYEEQIKTQGEAGRMIRELEAERSHRRSRRSG